MTSETASEAAPAGATASGCLFQALCGGIGRKRHRGFPAGHTDDIGGGGGALVVLVLVVMALVVLVVMARASWAHGCGVPRGRGGRVLVLVLVVMARASWCWWSWWSWLVPRGLMARGVPRGLMAGGVPRGLMAGGVPRGLMARGVPRGAGAGAGGRGVPRGLMAGGVPWCWCWCWWSWRASWAHGSCLVGASFATIPSPRCERHPETTGGGA